MVAELCEAPFTRADRAKSELGETDVVLYVGELGDDPRRVTHCIGYHDVNHAGVAYGFVFADVAAGMGEPWSTMLSHEVLELITDPAVNLLVVGPHPMNADEVVLRKYEICDPVQADTYSIAGVTVSNFVTPLYFAKLPAKTGGKTNFLDSPLERFGVRAGGFFSYFDLDARRWSDFHGPGAEARNVAKVKIGAARRGVRHRGQALAAARADTKVVSAWRGRHEKVRGKARAGS
jgi:hypothetical protein